MCKKKKVSQDEYQIATKLKKDSPISRTYLNYLEKMERMVNHKSRFLEQHLQIDPRISGSSPLQVVNLSTFPSSSLVLTDSSEK